MTVPILKTKADLDLWRSQQESPINFVPTMGGLHLGHRELISKAKKINLQKNPSVLVSIFINRLQFNAEEDFEKYPRDFINDCKFAENSGADAIWIPEFENVFPGGEESHFKINAPRKLQAHLCGAHRKEHFNGVATVIIRLLKLVRPCCIVLGEKDWQQFIIIRQLINDFGSSVKLEGIPTVRDSNGLALSSRNQYLNQSQLRKALSLHKALQKGLECFKQNQNISFQKIRTFLEENDLKVQYLEIVDKDSLTPIQKPKSMSLLAAAVHCGDTRLIDHIFLMKRSPIVAIDGPAGAGKSTVTKAFAKHLGLVYLDTGAMYRAVTWIILKEKIDPKDEEKVANILQKLDLNLQIDRNGIQKVLIDCEDITNLIRSPEVTKLVSIVAAQKSVRDKLTNQQKELGQSGGLVAEGRDIGTTVFPDAELKIFLTASPQERARRRAMDMKEKGFKVPNLLELENEIINRDKLDSKREISPLSKAEDAKELITDGMSIDQVVDALIELFRIEIPQEVWPNPY